MVGIDVVTGAFSYTGRYVARRLLAAGRTVRTLTNHPTRSHPFGNAIAASPYHFDEPAQLIQALSGAETLFNSYWVRFPHGTTTFEKAVQNSNVLFQAAKAAGVKRIVHVSIANPSKTSPLGYYEGKARVEEALVRTGLSYAILRPAVLFGNEDVLINNIAWMIRRFPVFGIPGDGAYKLQPIFVEDFADLLVKAGSASGNSIQDAVGPEAFSFEELVRFIAGALGKKTKRIHVSPTLTYWATSALGFLLRDVILTREEIRGLMDNLLVSQNPPLGWTRLSAWIEANRENLGKTYASEIQRHF